MAQRRALKSNLLLWQTEHKIRFIELKDKAHQYSVLNANALRHMDLPKELLEEDGSRTTEEAYSLFACAHRPRTHTNTLETQEETLYEFEQDAIYRKKEQALLAQLEVLHRERSNVQQRVIDAEKAPETASRRSTNNGGPGGVGDIGGRGSGTGLSADEWFAAVQQKDMQKYVEMCAGVSFVRPYLSFHLPILQP
jgi:hypothetical protein